MSQTSVESLGQGDKDGFLTKCGGRVKTWKKRWFVLKGDTLYYFKTEKDADLTGTIPLEFDSECKEDPSSNVKGRKYHFTVSTSKRTFVIFSDKEEVTKAWVNIITQKIQEKNAGTIPNGSPGGNLGLLGTGGRSPRQQVSLAKGTIPFLMQQQSKPLEFFQMWLESIAPREELPVGTGIEYVVQVSANLEKVTWRTAGPQGVFIQRLVDFFWNVGAPESEIDRLNTVGGLINPSKIGSWIDMSAKGGMDGGWYFPVQLTIKMALEAADPGECSSKLLEWAGKHGVKKCFAVGRDMGAAPPRQTGIRLHLPGDSHDAQMTAALDAFKMFGFSGLHNGALQALKHWKPKGMCLSIIISCEGFVRLGLMAPSPSAEDVQKFCQTVQADSAKLGPLEGSLGGNRPAFVEVQITKEGFGYGVYKEGYDVVFHYYAGEERG